MLGWKVAIQPRWTNPSELKRRMSIFKRYSENALLATRSTFKNELYKRTNKTTGTHIKSRRISNLPVKSDVELSQEYATLTVTLDTSNKQLRVIMLALEDGARIFAKGKLLTVPKHLHPGMSGKARSYTQARWVKLKTGHTALVTGRWGKDFRILYWGKRFVEIKPKNYWKDTAAASSAKLAKDYPKALEETWSRAWAELWV